MLADAGSTPATSTKYLPKHGKVCQVWELKGLILKGLSLFLCLSITKDNELQCTCAVYVGMYIAYPERASAGKKAREIIKDISHGKNLIVSKQERNRLVRNSAHWCFSHRIFKSLN